MYKLLQLYKLRLLFAHMLMGYLLISFSGLNLSTFYGIIVVIIGTYYILSKPDSKSQYPVLFSAYVVGLEVLLRMTNAQLFWEFGKYSVIYFLLLGMIRQRQSINILPQILFFFQIRLNPGGIARARREDGAIGIYDIGCDITLATKK